MKTLFKLLPRQLQTKLRRIQGRLSKKKYNSKISKDPSETRFEGTFTGLDFNGKYSEAGRAGAGGGSPWKTVIVVPAGRRRYLELLLPQIFDEDGWDELHIWRNTLNQDDHEYIESLKDKPNTIVIDIPKSEFNGTGSISKFFRYCQDPDAIYIRFDDDVIFIEPGTISELAQIRKNDPEPFLISPVVVNNALISYLFQQTGVFGYEHYIKAECLDEIAWGSPEFAHELHRYFLKEVFSGGIDSFKFGNRYISLSRFSINCIAFRGEDILNFDGNVPHQEEEFLSVAHPAALGRPNLIFGQKVVAHFAFKTQREYLDKTNLLQEYEDLVRKFRPSLIGRGGW